MSDLEEDEETNRIRSEHINNFAIPYVGPSFPPPAPGGGGPFPESRNPEINISMMAERRSSLEYVPHIADAGRGGVSSLIHSTAVVKQSSVIRPTPLSKIEEQTNLNLPPTNWLKDNPSSKGD